MAEATGQKLVDAWADFDTTPGYRGSAQARLHLEWPSLAEALDQFRDDHIREALKNSYKESPKWAKKVDEMSIEQATEVYIRFKANDKL